MSLANKKESTSKGRKEPSPPRSPSQKRPPEDPKIYGDIPFDFHEKRVVSYLWKVHHAKMVMCDLHRPNIYSPLYLNIPFILEMYPRGHYGDTFDIIVYLHWRLEKEAVVNVRLTFYGSERSVLKSRTLLKQKVSKDAPLLLKRIPKEGESDSESEIESESENENENENEAEKKKKKKALSLWDIHELESRFLIDDGYLRLKCIVWKFDGPPELASIDDSYHTLEVDATTSVDLKLLGRETSLTGKPVGAASENRLVVC